MINPAKATMIRRIMNDNAEYMNGVDRGQVRFGSTAVMRMVGAAIDETAEALKLFDAWDAMPADRGGKDGPKGKAYAAFIAAKDAILAALNTTGGSNDR